MDENKTEETGEEASSEASDDEKSAPGKQAPPPLRGIPSKNLGQAVRPGFRDPSNKNSKALKKRKGKKKR